MEPVLDLDMVIELADTRDDSEDVQISVRVSNIIDGVGGVHLQ